MSGNMEDDLFYDLFGERGFLTPESLDSTDQDSGHGSPTASTFDASPQQTFGWETSDHVGELWGSILDDLPSDITDESDSNDYKSPLSSTSNPDLDDQFAWSTKVVEESKGFEYDGNPTSLEYGLSMELENPMLDTKNYITDDLMLFKTQQNNNMDSYTNVDNNSSIADTGLMPQLENDLSPTQIMYQKKLEVQPSAPIVITPNNVNNKGPTWVVKAADIKSHFQLGQNIVAIIQNVKTENICKKTPLSIEQICNETINDNDIENDVQDDILQEDGLSPMNHSDHDYADKEIPMIKETTGVSKGLGPGLILTDEEKKLLELESLKLPEDAPLTKEEEKVLKKVRRKIKNKQSAMESRRKRKEYIENLERRVKHCTDLNHGLRKKVEKLTKENKSLVNQLKTMKEFIAASFNQTRTASTGTCLAVLVLSFALFILPFNPYQYDSKQNTLPTEGPNPSPMFRSRTLLSVEDNAEYTYHDNELNTSINSHLAETSVNELNTTPANLKFHFSSIIDSDLLTKKTNISMYIHQNSTLHSMILREKQSDHFINS